MTNKLQRKRISKIGSKYYVMCPNCGNVVVVGYDKYLKMFYCKECNKNTEVVDG